MEYDKTGIITEIVDNETIKVKTINSNDIITLKGNKFYISELKEAYENEETVIVKFNGNTLIDKLKEGDI